MTLADLVEQLDRLGDDLTIYAEKSPDWSPKSLAVVCVELEDDGLPHEAQGMDYLLEVFLAKDVVETWSSWREGRQPTVTDKCEAVIYYAEHDAYLPTEAASNNLFNRSAS